jgi:hypothetical protein
MGDHCVPGPVVVATEIAESNKWSRAFHCFKSEPNIFFAEYALELTAAAANPIPTCSFIQFLSRCLKIDRTQSHPEREIGRESDTDAASGLHGSSSVSSSSLKDGILCCAMAFVPGLLRGAGRLRGHHAYFLLILLKDVIKEIRGTPRIGPFVAQSSVSLHLFLCHCDYGPAAAKLVEVLTLLVDDSTLGPCDVGDKIAVFKCSLNICSVIVSRINDSSCQDRTLVSDCSFLARSGLESNQNVAIIFLPVMKLLNGIVTVKLYPELESCTVQKSELSAMSIDLDQLLKCIFSVRPVPALLAALSESDPSLVLTMLLTIEVHLRLDIIINQAGVDPLTRESRIYSSLLQTITDNKLEPIQMFMWLIKDALCYDASVLIDLLCGSETVALKYILRVVKYMKTNPTRLTKIAHGVAAEPLTAFLKALVDSLLKLNRRQMLPFNAKPLCDSIGNILEVVQHSTA